MGRLMKYELRSTLKLFAPLWLAVLALAGVNRLISRLTWSVSAHVALTPAGSVLESSNIRNWLASLAMVLYVVAIIGVFVVALIFVIQRFYQGLLKDEGYLTFTLPVRTDSILWAKTFSAMILIAGSAVVCILSVLLLSAKRDFWHGIVEGWRDVVEAYGGNAVLGVILTVIAVLASIIPAVQQLYLSMAIGHLGQKHRAGASVLAYVGIEIVLNMVTSLLLVPLVTGLVGKSPTLIWHPTAGSILWAVFGWTMLAAIVKTAIFYFPTRYILKRHLNLE